MTKIRVFVADDHPVYREGLARYFHDLDGITVVGSASDGIKAIRGIVDSAPDIAIVDLKLPGAGGVEVLEGLTRHGCTTRVLILTAYVDSAAVYQALAAGASGYLEKAASFEEITQAVKAIQDGDTVIAPVVNAALAAEIRTRGREEKKSPLSDRETAVLRLAADGLSAQRIARELSISLPTVRSHLAHIYTKLEVPDRASAVAQAFRRGLIS